MNAAQKIILRLRTLVVIYCLLITCGFSARALTPVQFNLKDDQDNPITLPLTLQGLKLQSSGNYIVVGLPIKLNLASGSVTTNLASSRYQVTVQGISQSFILDVPDTNTTQIAALLSTAPPIYTYTNNWNYKFLVDTNDTTPGHLADKLAAGANITLTVSHVGGNEVITIIGSGSGSASYLRAGTNVTVVDASGTSVVSVASMPFGNLTGLPSTLAGHGITDAQGHTVNLDGWSNISTGAVAYLTWLQDSNNALLPKTNNAIYTDPLHGGATWTLFDSNVVGRILVTGNQTILRDSNATIRVQIFGPGVSGGQLQLKDTNQGNMLIFSGDGIGTFANPPLIPTGAQPGYLLTSISTDGTLHWAALTLTESQVAGLYKTNVFDLNFTNVFGTNVHLATNLRLTNVTASLLTNGDYIASAAEAPFYDLNYVKRIAYTASGQLFLNDDTGQPQLVVGENGADIDTLQIDTAFTLPATGATAGKVWTSLSTDGTGHWAAASGGGSPATFGPQFNSTAGGTNIAPNSSFTNGTWNGLNTTNYQAKTGTTLTNQTLTYWTNGAAIFYIRQTNNLMVFTDSNQVDRIIITNGGGMFLNNVTVDNLTNLTSFWAATSTLNISNILASGTGSFTLGLTNLQGLPNTLAIYGANTNLQGLANGGANTVLHGTTPPAYSSVVEANLGLTDITTANASTSAHGFLPKLDGNAAHYLDGTGALSTPAGGGGGGVVPLANTIIVVTNLSTVGNTNLVIDVMGQNGGTNRIIMAQFTLNTNVFVCLTNLPPINPTNTWEVQLSLTQDAVGQHSVNYNTNYIRFPYNQYSPTITNASYAEVTTIKMRPVGTNGLGMQVQGFTP